MAVSETVRKSYAMVDEKDIPQNGALAKFDNKIVQVFESRADRDAFCKDNSSFAKPITAREAMRKIKNDVTAYAWRGVDVSRSSYRNDDWIAEYISVLGYYGFDIYTAKSDHYRPI